MKRKIANRENEILFMHRTNPVELFKFTVYSHDLCFCSSFFLQLLLQVIGTKGNFLFFMKNDVLIHFLDQYERKT